MGCQPFPLPLRQVVLGSFNMGACEDFGSLLFATVFVES